MILHMHLHHYFIANLIMIVFVAPVCGVYPSAVLLGTRRKHRLLQLCLTIRVLQTTCRISTMVRRVSFNPRVNPMPYSDIYMYVCVLEGCEFLSGLIWNWFSFLFVCQHYIRCMSTLYTCDGVMKWVVCFYLISLRLIM